MMKKNIIRLLLFFLPFIPSALWAVQSEIVREGNVEASLFSPFNEVTAGKIIPAALRLDHDAGWHTYWISTETGYAPSVEWILPEAWSVSDLRWPAPDIYATDYTVDYIYHDTAIFPFDIIPPQGVHAGEYVIQAKASWLMCEEVCIPADKVLLELKIVISNSTLVDEKSKALFDTAQDEMPKPNESLNLIAARDAGSLSLYFSSEALGDVESAYFFSDIGVTEFAREQDLSKGENGVYHLSFPISKYAPEFEHLTGILKITGSDFVKNIQIDLPFTSAVLVSEKVETSAAPSSLLFLLGTAFIGGMILNLMPCVFPVLGIKLMSVVSQSGSSRKHIFQHSAVYTLGVLISFWVLTLVFLVLRSTGEGLGWGFQLQSPTFVFYLALFFFLFGLNMSGLFEIGQSAVGAGANLQAKEGLSGSFFSGALATLAATPCSAPFLGAALGAAVAKPAWEMTLIFSFVALGLAFPFMLLPVFPAIMKLLPRPGAWMETFKQLMAFLLYATVAFLLWTLSAQIADENRFGVYALLHVFFALVVVALAAWQYGRWGALHKKSFTRKTATFVMLLLVVLASVYGRPVAVEKTVEWQSWEAGKAERLAAEGNIVYVDFTARWCVTCQTNKAAVFSGPGSDAVLKAFKDKKVIALKADWTAKDAAITEELAKYGKAAVPFNLIYHKGKNPIELPAVLTPGIVLESLD